MNIDDLPIGSPILCRSNGFFGTMNDTNTLHTNTPYTNILYTNTPYTPDNSYITINIVLDQSEPMDYEYISRL